MLSPIGIAHNYRVAAGISFVLPAALAFTSTSNWRLLSQCGVARPSSPHSPSCEVSLGAAFDGEDVVEPSPERVDRRSFLRQAATLSALAASAPNPSRAADPPSDAEGAREDITFHSAAYGREEYTNSIVASRDTNISPKEVYDTIASDYLKEAYDAATKGGGERSPRALDVGAGAGVSTEVLYNLGFRDINALDWSGAAWEKYVVEDPEGRCPPGVSFYELDDERYLDAWRGKYASGGPSQGDNARGGNGLFDVIVFNFAVNESKAKLFATQLLNKEHGRLLAPINAQQDYWLKQTYEVMDSKGQVLWNAIDVGAWSVQFQPDVTQDTCSGIWCAPFNGFQKK
ncbi:hypothetical protein ACHAWF_001587 [Thalassiosira exigua]